MIFDQGLQQQPFCEATQVHLLSLQMRMKIKTQIGMSLNLLQPTKQVLKKFNKEILYDICIIALY